MAIFNSKLLNYQRVFAQEILTSLQLHNNHPITDHRSPAGHAAKVRFPTASSRLFASKTSARLKQTWKPMGFDVAWPKRRGYPPFFKSAFVIKEHDDKTSDSRGTCGPT